MTEARHHVVDKTHHEGKELKPKIAWCGAEIWGGWHFLDAQHFIASLRNQDYVAWKGCRRCARAMSKVLADGLDDRDKIR